MTKHEFFLKYTLLIAASVCFFGIMSNVVRNNTQTSLAFKVIAVFALYMIILGIAIWLYSFLSKKEIDNMSINKKMSALCSGYYFFFTTTITDIFIPNNNYVMSLSILTLLLVTFVVFMKQNEVFKQKKNM